MCPFKCMKENLARRNEPKFPFLSAQICCTPLFTVEPKRRIVEMYAQINSKKNMTKIITNKNNGI